jgi:ABC-type antimicrobial peptide transport system permease subunit
MRSSASGASPVIISLGLAQKFFGSTPAVGRRLAIGTGAAARAVDVVGVVGDVKWADLRAEPRLMIYRASDPDFVFGTLIVRSPQPPDQVIAAVRDLMKDLAPGVPLADVGTMDADLDHQLVEERVIARLMGIVAIIAGLVALAGLYAVVAHLVTERTRELGIRIALGAPLPSITRIVLRPVVGLTLAGAAIGVGLILASTRFLAARVYHISPSDPVTVVAAIVALVSAALVAAWRPARRATKIDPVVAMRVD